MQFPWIKFDASQIDFSAIPAIRLKIFLALAINQSEEGYVSLSYARCAALAGCSRRAVIDHVKALEADGVLERNNRSVVREPLTVRILRAASAGKPAPGDLVKGDPI